MDLHSGLPFWLVKNGILENYPQLSSNKNCQVVILGGGITGAIQAYYLIKAGIKCIIIEKRSVGLGSTCASTALLQYQIDTMLIDLIEKVGTKDAIRSYELCAESIDIIEEISKEIGHKEFKRVPTLFYASSSRHLKKLKREFELHKENNFKVNYLNNKKLKENYGLNKAGGIESFHSAQIDAYKFCNQILEFCSERGLEIYDRTEAVKIDHRDNHVILQTHQGYTVKADWIVYATGYEIVNYIDKNIVKLNTTWAVISEQLEKRQADLWKNNALIWETAEPYLYMRTTKDRRIMIGGEDQQMNDPRKRTLKMNKKTQTILKKFNRLFPEIKFKPEFQWAGTFGSTKDGLPYIGTYKNKPRGLFALGFGGNGITFSVIGSKINTDIIKGIENNDKKIFEFDR